MSVMPAAQYALLILITSAITFALRAAPFLLFGHGSPPKVILYLGRVLPPAIMAMLVVYCLKDVSFAGGSRGMPEIIACALIVGLHIWKKNTLLSIFSGTIAYMLMVQFVF